MMWFSLLSVMVLSIGLSEAAEYRNYQGPFISIIKEKFGLTPSELKEKCEAKDKFLWNEVLNAWKLNLALGEDLITDIANRAACNMNPTAGVYEDLTEDRCHTNTVIVNVKNFTTYTIIQCLNQNELPDESRSQEMLIKSISETCTEIKLLAMERNAQTFQ